MQFRAPPLLLGNPSGVTRRPLLFVVSFFTSRSFLVYAHQKLCSTSPAVIFDFVKLVCFHLPHPGFPLFPCASPSHFQFVLFFSSHSTYSLFLKSHRCVLHHVEEVARCASNWDFAYSPQRRSLNRGKEDERHLLAIRRLHHTSKLERKFAALANVSVNGDLLSRKRH